MLVTIFSFIVVLGIVVFFHELGHFLFAKLFGVRVYKFSLGFPPKMIGFKKGETEYCISWVPLGGYVKMAGENPIEAEELGNDPGNLMTKPAWQKALIFAGGPLANYATAILIATMVFFFHGKEIVDDAKFVIGQVREGFPASQAGLQPGDIVRSIEDNPVTRITDLQETLSEASGDTMKIVWERDGTLDSASLAIAQDSIPTLKGEYRQQGVIGVVQKTDTLKVGPGEAFILANQATWNMTLLIGGFVKKLITGEASKKLLGGPITIAKFSGKKAREGLLSFFEFIVMISINLAILNLLPIPILDGGHLFILGIEVISRRKLSLKQRAVIQQIGLAFILLLTIYVTYNDIFVNWNN
ncbi:MAG: RIP metalloprotease RseP [candidate division Zixibacteria bacterium]|nr:RIP metalloprotease RseP [candidate division Zixibacteria bacterium]